MKCLILLAFASAALHAHAGDMDAIIVSAKLAPAAMHEECLHLDAGRSRPYSWKSDAPVDFNVHYHRGPDVFFPVKRDGALSDAGTFTAKTGEDYCWMWTAAKAPAKIEGRIAPE